MIPSRAELTALFDTYSDEALQQRVGAGVLTEVAQEIAEAELQRRGIGAGGNGDAADDGGGDSGNNGHTGWVHAGDGVVDKIHAGGAGAVRAGGAHAGGADAGGAHGSVSPASPHAPGGVAADSVAQAADADPAPRGPAAFFSTPPALALQPSRVVPGYVLVGHVGVVAALTASFAAGELPEARSAIASRIVAEFKSNRRLCPASLVDEMKALRQIANRVVLGVGRHLSHDDLVAAFTLRSKRLVTQETLSNYIAEAAPDEKVERLLFVEENLIGVENKRQLAGFVTPVVNSAPFENFFHNAKVPVMQRLQRLAQLQTRVRRSGFNDTQRQEIADKMDRLALAAAERAKLFETLDARSPNAVEKAQTLLKLATGGFLTEGALSARARELILGYLATPGFLAGYLTALPKADAAVDTSQALTALVAELGKAGIAAETGLKSIAA